MEAQTSRISSHGFPARDHAEGLDGNGGVAAPGHARLRRFLGGGEIVGHGAPVERLVEQKVRAVLRMDRRRVLPQRGVSASITKGRGSVLTRTFLGGVLGQRTACRDHWRPPIRRHSGSAPPPAESGARAACRARSSGARRPPKSSSPVRTSTTPSMASASVVSIPRIFRRRRGGGDERHVQRAGNVEIGHVAARARDEAAILAHPAVGRTRTCVRDRSFHHLAGPEHVRCPHPLGGRARSPRRSAGSRCSGRYCPRSPRGCPPRPGVAFTAAAHAPPGFMPEVQ